MVRFRDDKDWDRMALLPAPVGTSLIEELMASPNQSVHAQFSDDLREAVQEAISQLGPKDRFVIEAVYIWGYSYSEIADMMGYNSKGTPHYAVKKAERNLGAILKKDQRIIRLLKGNITVETNNWADGAWQHLRYFDRCATSGPFDPAILEHYFNEVGKAVRSLGDDENADVKLYDLCSSIGAESARGLVSINQWDTEAMLDVLCRKQHDYGHGNINAFGIVGVAVRISDKIARYNNLVGRNAKEQNESLLDTLMDMVGYAVISRMLEDGTFNLPLVWEM
jgi:Sigma-70, region 4/Nucleotide modification associated domain 1